jgi:hypothetical protein
MVALRHALVDGNRAPRGPGFSIENQSKKPFQSGTIWGMMESHPEARGGSPSTGVKSGPAPGDRDVAGIKLW